jgi:hypothetical protein
MEAGDQGGFSMPSMFRDPTPVYRPLTPAPKPAR